MKAYRFDGGELLPVCILRSSMKGGAKTQLTVHNDALFRPNSKPVAKAAQGDRNDYVFTPYHYHEGVEILRIVEGEASIIINNKVIKAKKGDIAIVNPFEAHGITLTDKHAPFTRDCVSFQPMNLFPEARGESGTFFTALRNITFENYIPAAKNLPMREIIDKIISDTDGAAPGWAISVLSSIMELYAISVREGWYTATRSELPAKLEFMTKVSSYIDANLSANISTSDAAAFCQYSPEHFCRLFKKCFHTTFLDYLNVYRVQKARSYVDEGNYPTVAELATMFGFISQNHFGNTFKRHIGVLPSIYIKERKQKENEQ